MHCKINTKQREAVHIWWNQWSLQLSMQDIYSRIFWGCLLAVGLGLVLWHFSRLCLFKSKQMDKGHFRYNSAKSVIKKPFKSVLLPQCRRQMCVNSRCVHSVRRFRHISMFHSFNVSELFFTCWPDTSDGQYVIQSPDQHVRPHSHSATYWCSHIDIWPPFGVYITRTWQQPLASVCNFKGFHVLIGA